MAMLTVRNLPEEVHKALRVKAAINGRSMEAEARAILKSAVLAGDPNQPEKAVTSEMVKAQ
ncbi:MULTISPECIES: Arc family DNA-binding protein [unclassified Marinobacter]|jgi:plasmid stability protein|uniref:FitA-like ribbon-helix-helix domain-containing protein n=1 Tax=unclassified Marinobacter TaxID=83889 RepID=UPI000C360101|nr:MULTISPECIES: Arc family DNA-binding protein [unclassified Marinobacter]MAB52964.1 hypothetical protein [Marinobacter sp.]MBN14028.1 hypothetical protein [Pelagibacterium sp.]|tara:strand:+ start:562 stop:744 length:183 start_codon:yes stop_codon:yes gene_type:complete